MIRSDDTDIARHFWALAHPRRVHLFRLLCERPESGASFAALQQASGLCDSSLTHHLREMERGGLILRRRKGVRMTFTVEPSGLFRTWGKTQALAGPVYTGVRRVA